MSTFIYIESHDEVGEGMRAELHKVPDHINSLSLVNKAQAEENTVRVVVINGESVLDWTPASERELSNDELVRSSLDS